MTVELFEPYPLQKEFIDNFIDSDTLIGVCAAPRGSGKTLLAVNMVLFWALDKPDRQLGWVSPIFGQARNVFDTIVESNYQIIKSSNRMELLIKLINGSTIKFLSADSPDSIRGFRFSHVVCDEVAFMKERTIDTNIMGTLNPSGQKLLLISTPKGKNHFFKYFHSDTTYSMKFPLTKCPFVKAEVIGEAKKSLPPDLFAQEFESAFIDSSNDVFRGLDEVSSVSAYDTRHQDVFIGVDTGLTSDMSVLTVINPVGKVVYIDAVNKIPINEIANRFNKVLTNYNVVGGYVESNGIGRAMYDLIKPMYRRVKNWNTTADNKTEMVRKLIHDIETITIELPTNELCPELHREFSTYSYKMSNTGRLSFSHVPGGNDDYVDSLMMANYSRVQFMDRKPIRVSGISYTKPMFKSPR